MPTLTGVRLYGTKDTDANWKKNDPTLAAGEIIIVTDSKYKMKVATTSAKYSEIGFPVAEKATQLETSRKIGNASFNGTADITLAQIGAAATSHSHTKSQITDFPASLKNPNSIVVKLNSGTTEGTNLFTYDGSAGKTINITPSAIGAAASSHSHTKSQITDFPTSLKNPSSVIVKLNGGTTEGTNMFTYDGSAAKTINITPSGIGAAASSHTHTKSNITDFPTSMPASDVYAWAKASTKPKYTWTEIDGKPSTFTPAKRVVFVGSDAASSNGWYKFATQTMSGYGDANIIFAITSTYSSYVTGILSCQIRSDNTSIQCPSLVWLVRQGFDVGSVIVVISGMTYSLYVNKTVSQYGRICIEVLSESNINGSSSGLNFVTSTSKESTAPTATKTATDAGTVNYANSAGSVTWEHVVQKPTTFTPSSHTHSNFIIKLNGGTTEGTNLFTYNGGTAKTINITPSSIGAAASSHSHTKSQITDFPTTLKNPSSITVPLNGGTTEGSNKFTYDGSAAKSINITASGIGAATSGHTHSNYTIKLNGGTAEGTNLFTYNGGSAKTINITPSSIGAAASSHTHTKSQITDFPTSLKNPSSIAVKLNGGSTEGTNLFTYDGSAAKTVNITPSAIGAATSGHNHDSAYAAKSHTHNYAGSSSAGGAATSANKLATARTLSLTGLSNATFTFDGSGNVSADNWGYGTAKCVTTNSADKPYFRIAYTSTTGSYADASMILMIDSGNTSAGFGILKVSFRSDNIATAGKSCVELVWLVRQGFGLGQFFVKGYAPANAAQYADLYFKAAGTYNGVVVTALSMGGRGSKSRSWTFESGDPRAAADIRTYSYTTTSSDAGVVSYNKLADKPSSFTPSSHTHTKSQITDFPTSLQNPNSITIKFNGGGTEGTNLFTYNGSAAKTINITASSIGAAASSHSHTKSQITDFPTSLQNPNTITIKLNGGTTEGTNLFTYNGGSAKTLNITASSIGAAASSHSHSYAAVSHTHTKSQITDFPSSLQNPNSITIKLNGGSTEGTNLFTYNGSSAKSLNITASSIGAATSGHSHSYLPLSGGTVTGNTTFNNGVTIKNAGLELYYTTPFIDFHKDNSTDDYTSRIIENSKGVLNVNGTCCTKGGSLWCTSFSTDGGGTFGGDLSANRGLYLKHAGTSLYLYNDNGGFVMMHTGTDGNSSWPVIWSFASSDIYFNSNLRVTGTGKFPAGLYAGSESRFYVNSGGAVTAASITTDGAGTFGGGVNATKESTFCSGSYTDPLPGVSCGIKVSGIATATRFYVKGRSTSWLNGAQPGGAGFECVNDGVDNALIPGWRIRNYSGAWVGSSYNLDKCFHLYYAKAERLSGNTSNGTDADFVFNANTGNFAAKSVTQTSDERLKNIISTVIRDDYKNLFMRLKPFTYKWNDNPDDLKIHIGLGAQTVYQTALDCGLKEEEISFVTKGEKYEDLDFPWSIGYTELIPLNISITQDHDHELKEQKKEIVELKEENRNLADRVEALEKENQKILAMLSELLKK